MPLKRNVNGGFSLLEMTVVIIVATILATAIIPQLIKGYSINAANKTALDISAIQEASRAYYIANNSWPANIAELQAGNYLPSSWNAVNPFGYSSTTPSNYIYNLALSGNTNGASLIVSTYVPNTAAQTIIENLLPASGANSTTGIVSSGIPVPGASSVLPTGLIIPWASNNLPLGYLWCNGQPVSRTIYSGLFLVIGTIYGVGDGDTTFNLPNVMDRTVVGVDGMGGVSAENLITQWSTAPATMGGIFGEDAHRQSVTEMAPHEHGETGYAISGGGAHELRYSDSNTTGDSFSGDYTLSSGGNGDGTGLGAPANVIQPSIALGYIIKY